MPIILAIEPDRRQAAHLAGIVRQRVSAELIVADTTEGALDAIGNRIPDLVLVPALLSPQDDAALAAALRVIAAAAHVRTLTIPVLSSGVGGTRTQPGGMLAKWRRGRSEAVPDGCDPAVFAEQINAYLKEAAAERAELELAPERDLAQFEPALAPESDVTEFEPIEPPAAAPLEMMAAEPIDEMPFEPIAVTPFEPIAEMPFEPIDGMPFEPIAEMAAEPIEPPVAEWANAWAVSQSDPAPADVAEPAIEEAAEPWRASAFSQPVVDLSEELAGLEAEAIDEPAAEAFEELFAGEPFGVYTISSPADEATFEVFEEAAIDAASFEEEVVEEAVAAEHATGGEAVAMEAADVGVELAAFEMEVAALTIAATEVDAIEEPIFDASPEDPDDEVEAPCLDIEAYVPMYLQTRQMWPPLEGVPVEPPTAKSEHPEWLELVASLRQDIERRRSEPSKAPTVAARTADAASAKGTRPVKKQKMHANKEKPIQDEWGFFDPEQCGFSALLAKLDEITDVAAEEPDGRRPS
jgi:hypothetical protein